MIRRIASLYHRFAALNLSLRGRNARILDAHGRIRGYADHVRIDGGRLTVEGWTRALQVRLVLGEAEAICVPTLLRQDVAVAHNIPPHVGFQLSLPCPPAALRRGQRPALYFDTASDQTPLQPLVLRFPMRHLAGLRLRLLFLRLLVQALPAIFAWRRDRNLADRSRIKRILRLDTLPAAQPLTAEIFDADAEDPPPPLPGGPVRITVVLPVYNAFELLQEALDRVMRHTDLPWRLILIEDCSTDPRVRPWLRDWVAARRDRPQAGGGAPCRDVRLIEHEENLGFIRAVNTGLALAMAEDGPDEGPVVLLNSDALVPEGWASRLIRPLALDPTVASVTPMSNDAEIFSVPLICQRRVLRPGQGDAIDAAARRFAPDQGLAEAPTGVGFCMAIGRPWLEREPALDTIFGRGYGEEVDWCQRVRLIGGRHLGLPGLFVEHRGGESFGSEEKQALVIANNEIVAKRYPAYDQEVQNFILGDPLLTPRLALAFAWAGSLDPDAAVPVYMAHSLGGGAEVYLQERIAADLDRGGVAVILRVGRPRRWRLELVTAEGILSGETDDTTVLREMMDLLPCRHLVYSEGVGDSDPVTLPDVLLSIARPQDRVEMLFHDFFPLSPSYTLLDAEGVYRGPPGPELVPDKAHEAHRPNGERVSLRAWQAAWRRLAGAADELRVFSHDSAALIREVWPDMGDRIRIVPHVLPEPGALGMSPPAAAGAPVIGVLGNIGQPKGAGVVAELAGVLRRSRAARLVVIGNIDPSFPMPAGVPVHGSYLPGEIPALARKYGVTHWLIPSVWPETFSYTTHEAVATGLPVLAFDIGAQGETVARVPNGVPVPFEAGGDHAAAVLSALASGAAARKVAV
ncbi:glycosyltransferase [Pseudooceanicola sp.]|uniref:glycosyltransferase n=1 Tax=Pseudooceanicola sp. TaxID=1914328 RepID=UPI0035188AF0